MPALRLLMLEDSEDDALIIVRHLRKAGYTLDWRRVETAEDFVAALEEPWDVVIGDYSLPRYTGLEALAVFRDRDLDVPFILVSGKIGEETAVAAMRAGAHDYILKHNLARLAPAIERELRDAESRRRRREAEAALASKSRLLTIVLDSMSDAVFAVSPEGRLEVVNAAAMRLVGDQDLERWREAYDVLYADGVTPMPPEERPLAHALRGEAAHDVELVLPATDEHGARCVSVSATPLRDADGEAGAVLVVRDVTERRRSEDALRERDEQLRQAQKMEAIGRLAGGIAHDFNNLLSVITGYSDLLLARLAKADPMRTQLEHISHAAARAAALTRQLLTFSRQQVTDQRLVDLHAVLTGMRPMLERLLGEDVELEVRSSGGIGAVSADLGQLEQVVMNLVINARDAMPTGGRVTLGTSEVELYERPAGCVPAIEPGRYVRLEVRDTGVGMDAEVLARLFEPFFTTKETGTGLGLSIVYGIVTAAGGCVRAHSRPGRGAMFEVLLPTTGASADVAVAPEVYTLRGGPETILLVEDDPDVRELTRAMLVGFGYDVLVASNAGEALLLVERHGKQIGLLLTDVVMRHVSGVELAERVRRVRPDLRVLFMSGYARGQRVMDGVPYLQKPFSAATLARRVREVLDGPAASPSAPSSAP